MISLILGDLIELKYGKSLRKDTRKEGSVPVFGSNGQVDVHSESCVNHPTIIVGRKGSIGEVHLVKTPCWPIDTTYFVEPLGKHEFDLDWLYRLLQTLRLQELNRSAAIPGLNREDVYRIPVLLPSLDEQIRIAHLLGKVEGLIAQRKQHLQQLDDLLKSVFLEMFGKLHISEGESTLGDCLKIQQGFAFKSEEFIDSGTPIIKIGTVNKGFFDYSTLSFIDDDYSEKIRRFEIKPGDLLISLTGTVGKDDYANTCFVPVNSAYPMYLLNQRVGKLICDPDIVHPLFVNAFLKLPKVKSALIKQNRGVRQANLSNSDIYNIKLSIPPVEQQNQFAAFVEKVESIKSRYQQSLTNLEHLYGALSQQAFKGELDLSRVTLPSMKKTEEKKIMASTPLPAQTAAQDINLPETDLLLSALKNREYLQPLLHHWLDAYRGQLGGTPFSVQHFIAAAQTRVAELHPDNDFELGASDYDHIKAWAFEALAEGRLQQSRNITGYDEKGNPILGNLIELKRGAQP